MPDGSLAVRSTLFPVDIERVVSVDFETYYDQKYSLRAKAYSTSSYVRDPQFKAHCVGIKIGTGTTVVYWEDEIAPALNAIDWSTHYLLCHHAQFDGLILSHHYGIVPMLYLDTLSMARALHSNQIRASLDAVASFYGVGNKLPNVLSKMKGQRVIPDELRPDATSYTKTDVDIMFAIFRTMITVYPERELRLIDLTVRFFTEPVLDVDQVRAGRELEHEIAEKRAKIARLIVDEDKVANATDEEIEDIVAQLQSAGKFAKLLQGLGVEPPMKLSPRTKQMTYAFSQQDEEFMALGAHPDERVRLLIAARLAVKSTIGETRARRLMQHGDNMKLPLYLNYCGAHTTRWSGGDKMNPQNFGRDGELRKSIIAPPGHVIVAVDSAQIECRTNMWLAKQLDVLEVFAQGGDVYSRTASECYGHEVSKETFPEKRFVGKVATLGLGYQMGPPRFQGTLALGIMGPQVFIELPECQRIVRTWRRKHDKVVKQWKSMEDVLYHMLMKRVNGKRDDYTDYQGVFSYDEQSIWLPNGLGLHYPDLRGTYDRDKDTFVGYSYRSNKQYVSIYGGLLTENVIQALSRVIVAEQMIEIADKYRVVTMTHDEVVACAPKQQADACLEDMITAMRKPPAWCADLPLDAEGSYGPTYS
jgi:hypothetical protein